MLRFITEFTTFVTLIKNHAEKSVNTVMTNYKKS